MAAVGPPDWALSVTVNHHPMEGMNRGLSLRLSVLSSAVSKEHPIDLCPFRPQVVRPIDVLDCSIRLIGALQRNGVVAWFRSSGPTLSRAAVTVEVHTTCSRPSRSENVGDHRVVGLEETGS